MTLEDETGVANASSGRRYSMNIVPWSWVRGLSRSGPAKPGGVIHVVVDRGEDLTSALGI